MRGSRPGERGGGRQKGTPNKKAVIAAHSAKPNVTPMDVMLAVMRAPHVALDMRVKMALKALPRLHRKLAAGEPPSVAGDERLTTRCRTKPSPEAQRMDGPSVGTTVKQNEKQKSDGPGDNAPAPSAKPRKSASVGLGPANVQVAPPEGDESADLMPLPFLLGVLNDAKTPPALQVKVSLAIPPYTHPSKSKRAKPTVGADRYGFTVDPGLATKLRNETAPISVLKKRRNPSAKEHKAIQKLNEKIDAKLASSCTRRRLSE